MVHGFNDIFVVIAAVIALAGLWTIGNTMSPLIGGGLVAVASWLLSEYFTRRRHMALPSIVLLVTALGGTFGGVIMQLLAMAVRPTFIAVSHLLLPVPLQQRIGFGSVFLSRSRLGSLRWLVSLCRS